MRFVVALHRSLAHLEPDGRPVIPANGKVGAVVILDVVST